MKLYNNSKIVKNISRFFFVEDKGAIAVIFALMMLPLMALAGAAVDYSKASSIKNQLQASADSAALAAGRASAQSDDEDFLEEIAKKVFFENMLNSGFAENIVDIEVIFIEDGVRVEVSTDMDTNFLQLVGMPILDIGTFSEIGISAAQLEVVLALDTTLSMSGAKITALKRSARLLVDTLMSKDEGGTVNIGLVPFARYVNIGMSNRNEPGIEVPDDYSVARSDYCRNTYPNSTRRCDRRRETYSCSRDGIPSTCSRWVYYNCTGSSGAPVYVCTPRTPLNYRWYGCVGSRDYPLNIRDDRYGANPVPGLLSTWNFCRTNPLTRLTNDKSTIISGINAMIARDNTYIPAGLAWGWRLLSAQIPFSDAAVASDEIKKVLVIMTDGMNTVSPSYPWHNRSDENEANDLTEELCANIKDDDIIIYSIAFEVSNNSIKNILQDCAGNGGSYFDADNAIELEEAFKNIAKELMDLRLTR